MKNKRLFCMIVLTLWVIQSLAVPVLASSAVEQGSMTLDGQVSVYGDGKLLDTAKSVILYEMETGTLVYSWDADLRIDPSGMNKIMTAMLAIELGDPDTIVTVERAALDSVGIGSVSAGLKAGEEMSLRDLLYCMMVGSANDAAAVIAQHIGSDQERFVQLMNQKAQELGCTDTNFMNANGLSHEQQYTTARDLAKITLEAIQDPLFVELFGAVSYTVPATNRSDARELVTTNYLMLPDKKQYDQRVIGGKTGALSTTDRSLICTAEVDGLRYLSVVMSAQGTVTANGLAVKTFGSFEETGKLLDHGFDNYSIRQLLYEDQVMEQFQVTGGENDVIGRPAQDLMVVLPKDIVSLDVSYQFVTSPEGLTAPILSGGKIGTIEVWFRGKCVGSCDLVAMHDVDQPGVDNISLIPTAEAVAQRTWTTWLLLIGIVIFGALLIFIVVLIVMRRIRLAKIERRHKIIRGETGGKQ
ncbi:MAG: D-alanyl-D-alanine carboxypeptidase [Oscillospiraceae bacterium]|nr:D-alanyl-D-alanine carboxypeptidase [Oscillospiraceae bacterium]